MRQNQHMTALIVIVVLVIGAMALIGALAFVGALGFMASDEKKQKQAEANAPAILDAAFDGDAVTFKVDPSTLKYETVVVGARARGYSLIGETVEPGGRVKTLVFGRA